MFLITQRIIPVLTPLFFGRIKSPRRIRLNKKAAKKDPLAARRAYPDAGM
jgi:hypothetical protein